MAAQVGRSSQANIFEGMLNEHQNDHRHGLRSAWSRGL